MIFMRKGKMVVYLIKNIVKKKINIGKEVRNQKNYMGSGKIIRQALKKYGRENFKKEVLEKCTNKESLALREKYWIQLYKSKNFELYNIAEGGEGGRTTEFPWNFGLKLNSLSEEHKKKISNSLIGRKRPQEVRKKISESHKGRSKSEKHKKTLSEINMGKKLSEETKIKMSNVRKNVKQKILTCPYCGKEGGTTMHRWHFNNCKLLKTDR